MKILSLLFENIEMKMKTNIYNVKLVFYSKNTIQIIIYNEYKDSIGQLLFNINNGGLLFTPIYDCEKAIVNFIPYFLSKSHNVYIKEYGL